MNGTSLQELIELGGWKSFKMFLRYAHLAPEHLVDAAARNERRWGGRRASPYDFPTLETKEAYTFT